MRVLTMFAMTLVFVGVACSNSPPTPVGTVVLQADLKEHVPEKLHPQLKDAKQIKTHTDVAKVAIDDKPPAEAIVTWHTLEGSFITDLEVKIKDNKVCQVTTTGPGNPINVGTFKKPLMSVSFLMACTHTNGRQLRTVSFHVRADGKLVNNW